MPTYNADVRLLDTAGAVCLKSFTMNDGGGNTLHAPDWDTDPTYEIVTQHGLFTIDRFGPKSIYQEAETINNPPAGNTLTIATLVSFTLMRIDNPAVVSPLITPAAPLDCVLSAPTTPVDLIDPYIVTFSPSGTSVPPAAQLTMSWNEIITRGANRNITLYNATDNSILETFDLDTAPTSGPGSVATSSVTAVVTPTNAMPNGKQIALRMDGGAFLDAAGRSCQAITDNTYSFAVSSVAPPAPISGDVIVGAQTGSGVKVHPATSYSGSSHFQLVGGFIETTAAGAAADFNGSPYNVLINGSAAVIATVANGISVDSIASAHSARDIMQASPSTDWTMILCSGVDFPLGSTWAVANAAMNGTWSHPDFTGYTVNKNADNYTVGAETTVSGGSITIRPSGDESGMIYCDFTIHSNARVIWDGVINFAKYSTTFQYSLTEPAYNYLGTSTSVVPYRTVYQGTIGNGVANPTGCCIFKNGVDFGIGKLGLAPNFAVSVLYPNNIGYMSFEKGCRADGFIIFANFGWVRAYNFEDFEATQSAEDWIRCFNTKNIGTSPLQRRVVRSTLWKPYGYSSSEADGGVSWLAFHADAMQDKANADAIPIGGIVADVLVYQTVDCANLGARIDAYFNGTGGKPNFANLEAQVDAQGKRRVKARGTQGMLIGNTTSAHARTTQFKRCIIIGNTANGWDGHNTDAVDCDDIIVFHDSLTMDAKLYNGWSTGSMYRFSSDGSQNSTYHGIVAHSFPVTVTLPVGSETFTMANNISGTMAPNSLFAGTDGNGGGFIATSHTRNGVTHTGVGISGLNMSSVAAFRADIKARFTPRASGALAGRNFFNA